MRNAVLGLCFLLAPGVFAAGLSLRPGTEFLLAGRSARIEKVESLPFVESEFTHRFRFDSAENPRLRELKTRCRLDEVVAGAKDEFEKQVLLNDWVHRQFKKFGRPSSSARGALEILPAINEGHTFFCAQYAELMVSASASLGWTDRLLALRRHAGVNARGGSTEHSTTEIWSDQYRKWVMLDPTSNMYLEKDGLPLNAWEIRQEWFYRAGTNLTFVVGRNRSKYTKADLPIVLEHFADFGDLTVEPDELDKYGFIGYIPNTDLMDAPNDYGRMFIVKDQLCNGTKWHERTLPRHPETDPYFPLNQVEFEADVETDEVTVYFRSFTPNFDSFQVRVGDRGWRAADRSFRWKLHPGSNRLQARAKNKFAVEGAVSTLEIALE